MAATRERLPALVLAWARLSGLKHQVGQRAAWEGRGLGGTGVVWVGGRGLDKGLVLVGTGTV